MSAQPQEIRSSPLGDMTSLMVHNSGPFYCYAPGEAIHRVDARDSVPHVWAGLLIPVTDFPQLMDTAMSGPYAAGTSPDGKKTVNRVWASHQVDLIHRPYFPRAIQVTALDRLPLVTCRDNFSVVDNLLSEFNHMICPVPVGYEEWDLPPEARRVRIPADVADEIVSVGALAYRDRCLADAEKLCEQTQIGQALYSAILQMRGAIKGYAQYATAYLEFEENLLDERKGGNVKEGKARYDNYDRKLLWLLGRAEKKTQAPQVIVQGGAQTLTMDPAFGESIGNAIAAAVAPLRDEIERMKRKKPQPRLINRKPKTDEAE